MSSEQIKKNVCPRGSVGAIIQKDDEYLVLYRKVFPKGLAFVAGHVDEREKEEDALVREVFEETGLVVVDFQLVLDDTFPNPCKKGYTSHAWWVYQINRWEGEPKHMEKEKHTFVRFMSLKEIQSYIDKRDVDPAWLTFILPAIHLIPFEN